MESENPGLTAQKLETWELMVSFLMKQKPLKPGEVSAYLVQTPAGWRLGTPASVPAPEQKPFFLLTAVRWVGLPHTHSSGCSGSSQPLTKLYEPLTLRFYLVTNSNVDLLF